MEIVISFLVSVVAGIVAYYICKWLDRNDKDNEYPKWVLCHYKKIRRIPKL